jgi:hypothetical protein
MGGSLRRKSSVIFFCLREAEPVQEQLVTLEETQGAVENIEQGEGIVGVLRLVGQPLDQALLLVDVLFRSANALLDDSKVIAFGIHLIAPKSCMRATVRAPEGFYTITPELMNPNSNFYLAINIGFPNGFDKANNRDGSSLMIHGDCSSSGCYAITDEQISEIYSLARDSLLGRPSFQIQAYPFRLTPANLARHRTNPHLAFWKMLKIGNDHFEATHLEPKVDVCNRLYVFDAQPPPNSPNPLVFNPTVKCPAFVVNPKIARRALEKQRTDEVEYASTRRSEDQRK